MGPYPRLRDPKALKPSAFRMISWAKSRFSRVISSRRQDLFIVFIRVKALVRALFSVHVVTRKLKKSVTYYFNVRNPPHEKNIAKKIPKKFGGYVL